MEKIPLGPFELHTPIGKGGMGEVWQGTHVPQNVPVAVKVLTQAGARRDAYVDAFQNEVRAVAALDHPGIIMPLDYGEIPLGSANVSDGRLAEGSPYIVMELARRGNLRRFQSVIGWAELKLVLFTLLDALAHAHAAGVIHRDLKPANILVGCTGPSPGIKITDFGLARAIETFEQDGLYESGWGTPHYMAPEQFRGLWRDYGPWTDLYALGVMAYELASGHQPFKATSQMGFARAHALTPPPRIEPNFPVPEGFENWVMRLLQKNPEDRYLRAADAAWGLKLLGDPEGHGSIRRTVSMIASSTQPQTEITAEESIDLPPQTDQGFEIDPDPTILDRPETTRLIESGDVHHTMSLAMSEWDEVELPNEFEGDLPVRNPPPLPFTWRRPSEHSPSLKLLGAGLGLYGIRAIRMVGRSEERDAIWDALKSVRMSGRTHVVVIRGAAGTGKSRLAEWVSRRAHEVGSAESLLAVHSPMEGVNDGLPRMLSRHFRTNSLERKEVRARLRDVLKRYGFREELDWEAFTELVSPAREPQHEERVSIRFARTDHRYGLIRRYLHERTLSRPALIVLDDVQWGSDSLAFAQYMADRPDSKAIPALIVCTVREEALADRPIEAAFLKKLEATQNVTRIDLTGLDDVETDALVRELLLLDGDLADQVEKRAGGNPLFAVQLVGDWVAGGKLQFGPRGFELRKGARADVPDDIHEIWMGRLDNVSTLRSGKAWKALEIAASLGRDIDHEEWQIACRFAGIDIDNDFSQELLQDGLALPNDDGWRFVHGMLRESLERHAREKDRWVAVNKACVQMLQTRYPHREFPYDERIARHLMESRQSDLAIEPLRRAAKRRLELSDFEVAHAHVQSHQRVLKANAISDTDTRWGQGWHLLAELALEQGRYEDAQRFAERIAIEARRHGWRTLLPQSLVVEGVAQQTSGKLRQAKRSFERARELYEELNDLGGVARAVRGIGRVAQYQGNYIEAVAKLTEAKTLFEQGNNSLGVARCLNALGDVTRQQGRFDESREYSLEAMHLCDEVGNQIGVADCINDLAELSRLEGDLEPALNSCERALTMYESLGSDESMFVRINLGLILLQYARYSQARQIMDELRAHFKSTGQGGLLASVNVFVLPCLAALGEWDIYNRRLTEASSLLNRTGYHSADIPKALRMAAEIATGAKMQDEAARAAEMLDTYTALARVIRT